MHAIVQADRELGRSFSLLFPFQHGFYRRLGYGSVGLMHYWRVPLAHLPDEPALRARVRVPREADRPIVEDLFARTVRASAEGGLERNPGQWQRRWTQDEKWVVYDADGVRGYMAYRAPSNALEVRELVASTSEAERGLWSFVGAQVEQRASASYIAPVSKPLWAMLREPYMFEGPQHGFIINDVAGLTMSFMARGIDWSTALAARDIPSDAVGHLGVVLSDAVFGACPFGLELADGHASVREAPATVDVRCDVSIFSQLYCGALSATNARWFGLLDADDAAVTLLDRAFPPGPPFIAPADWF
jgi:predicted acetyltransferase